MIKSFKCKETERIWTEGKTRRLPSDIQTRALNKLKMMNVSLSLDDLRFPPGNNLEPLLGTRTGQHSIRLNERWRICFVW